ncbi:MAG: LURP-one-related/scramblase family protein, partial [Syntrophothermus sp.]
AVVMKALISPLRDRWMVKVANGPDLDVQGDIFDHEYDVKQGHHKIAEVSKKWFRLTDTYGVEVAEGQNDILILAIAVAMDAMTHERR